MIRIFVLLCLLHINAPKDSVFAKSEKGLINVQRIFYSIYLSQEYDKFDGKSQNVCLSVCPFTFNMNR